MQKLHPVQSKLIEILKANTGESLTLEDLREAVGSSYPSVVHHHIKQLEKKGYIRRNPTNPSDYLVLADNPEKNVAFLNVYGMAQCGPNGTILDGNPIERVPIATKLLGFRAEEAFIVKARGMSMTPKINPGDYVIAQKISSDYPDGSIVVGVNNGTVLIKKVQKNTDNSQHKRPLLKSLNEANGENKPFFASEDFRAEGIVRGILTYKIE